LIFQFRVAKIIL